MLDELVSDTGYDSTLSTGTRIPGFEDILHQGDVRYFQSSFSSGKLVLKV